MLISSSFSSEFMPQKAEIILNQFKAWKGGPQICLKYHCIQTIVFYINFYKCNNGSLQAKANGPHITLEVIYKAINKMKINRAICMKANRNSIYTTLTLHRFRALLNLQPFTILPTTICNYSIHHENCLQTNCSQEKHFYIRMDIFYT